MDDHNKSAREPTYWADKINDAIGTGIVFLSWGILVATAAVLAFAVLMNFVWIYLAVILTLAVQRITFRAMAPDWFKPSKEDLAGKLTLESLVILAWFLGVIGLIRYTSDLIMLYAPSRVWQAWILMMGG